MLSFFCVTAIETSSTTRGGWPGITRFVPSSRPCTSGVGGMLGVNSMRMVRPVISVTTLTKMSVTKVPRTLRLAGQVRKKAHASKRALTARPLWWSIA